MTETNRGMKGFGSSGRAPLRNAADGVPLQNAVGVDAGWNDDDPDDDNSDRWARAEDGFNLLFEDSD